MSKRNFLIVGNWKMNPITASEARRIVTGVKKIVGELKKVKAVLCPPFLYLPLCKKTDNLSFGVQDIFWEMNGARTGEISAEMANNAGAEYSIIGHSERRALGETDEIINKKVDAAIRAGITPIVCVGESVRDNQGNYFSFIKDELHAAFAKIKRTELKNIVIAYEPLWAIGKPDTEAATPRDIHEMTIFIRKIMTDLFDQASVSHIKVLYGGSVSARNAEAFLAEGNADGLLVGRDSLSAKNFGEILTIAEKLK